MLPFKICPNSKITKVEIFAAYSTSFKLKNSDHRRGIRGDSPHRNFVHFFFIVDETVQAFGKINILVNNAHVSKQVMLVETSAEDFALSFNTSFYPTFYLMQLCYPYLKETKGSVINFASGAGLSGMPTQAAYGYAKEAIRGLSRVAANEWGVDGINVNCISPIANSPGVQKWSEHFPAEYQAMVDNIPLKRLGDCENDIGRIAVFLASDDSSYMTGQTLMADGGSVMLR